MTFRVSTGVTDDAALIERAIDRLTRAVEKQRTLVPLILMVPHTTTAEQAHEFLQHITHALREAGLMPPEEGSDG